MNNQSYDSGQRLLSIWNLKFRKIKHCYLSRARKNQKTPKTELYLKLAPYIMSSGGKTRDITLLSKEFINDQTRLKTLNSQKN